MFACCSLDEDKIFERILADNWEAKDRSVQPCCYVHVTMHVSILIDVLAMQIGQGSCKASKERFGCCEKAICIIRGKHFD